MKPNPARTIDPRRRTGVVITLLVLSSILVDQPADAQSGMASERNVKVAYLYNFLRYVRWPETAYADESSPTVIGILAGGGESSSESLIRFTRSKPVTWSSCMREPPRPTKPKRSREPNDKTRC